LQDLRIFRIKSKSKPLRVGFNPVNPVNPGNPDSDKK
jgi:hypothetical protein